MGGRIDWQDYWGLRKQAPLEYRLEWDKEIGFEIDEERNHIKLYPRLANYVDNCSTTQLVEFITGAPIQLACLYISKLPQKYAKKVVLGFRLEDIRILERAYFKPPQIAAPKPAEPESGPIDTWQEV